MDSADDRETSITEAEGVVCRRGIDIAVGENTVGAGLEESDDTLLCSNIRARPWKGFSGVWTSGVENAEDFKRCVVVK